MTKFSIALLASAAVPFACACAAPSDDQGAAELAHDPVSLEGWKPEIIPLPPGFAPDLPTGTESLLFAPDWRDADSEDFWSYAFVMWIYEPAPDAERLDELLESYYDGLMIAVGEDGSGRMGDDPAKVEVALVAPNRFEVSMRLVDAFTTFEELDLRVLVDVAQESEERTVLRVRASPQPADHEIWRSLEAAVEQIEDSGPQSQPRTDQP